MNLATVVWILGQLGLLSGGIGNLLLSPQDVSSLLEIKGCDDKLLLSILSTTILTCLLLESLGSWVHCEPGGVEGAGVAVRPRVFGADVATVGHPPAVIRHGTGRTHLLKYVNFHEHLIFSNSDRFIERLCYRK